MSCIIGLKNYLINFFFSGNILKLRSHVFLFLRGHCAENKPAHPHFTLGQGAILNH